MYPIPTRPRARARQLRLDRAGRVVAGISNAAGSGTTATITETLINTTTEPVSVAYIITPSVNGCAGTPFTLTVTVNPTAVITSAATAAWCNNVSNTYTATSSSRQLRLHGAGLFVAGISNAAGNSHNRLRSPRPLSIPPQSRYDVVYIITRASTACAGTPFTLTVTVNPTAVITSAATANWCNNVSNTYTATSSSTYSYVCMEQGCS